MIISEVRAINCKASLECGQRRITPQLPQAVLIAAADAAQKHAVASRTGIDKESAALCPRSKTQEKQTIMFSWGAFTTYKLRAARKPPAGVRTFAVDIHSSGRGKSHEMERNSGNNIQVPWYARSTK
jgi:hypothetical protein